MASKTHEDILPRYLDPVDPIMIANILANVGSGPLSEATTEAWEKLRKRLAQRAVDEALANVQGAAKAEVDALSESTREDLRGQLLESLDQAAKAEVDALSESTRKDLRLQFLESLSQEEREIWASVMTMQSSERFSSKIVTATWGLVTATVGLVIATVILVIVTLINH